jgi:hypothetical protein
VSAGTGAADAPEARDGCGGPSAAALADAAARRFDRLPGRHALALSLADGTWLRRHGREPFAWHGS